MKTKASNTGARLNGAGCISQPKIISRLGALLVVLSLAGITFLPNVQAADSAEGVKVAAYIPVQGDEALAAGRGDTVRLPALKAAARVFRDVDGIPHVIANNEQDMLMLEGWVHARDRLFQMDFYRRVASGTLAEILGPGALGSDVEMRTIGLRRAAERSLPILSAEAQAGLEAYAAGVNAYVASHPLPPEYQYLEITQFEPWTALDSLAMAKLLVFSLSFEVDIERTQALLAYQTAGAAAGFDGAALFFEDLWRSAPFDPVFTIPDASVTYPFSLWVAAQPERSKPFTASPTTKLGRKASLPKATVRMLREYRDRVRGIPWLRRACEPDGVETGSNEWVIGGRLTANGMPLLAHDPHLGFETPSLLSDIHLTAQSEKLDVIGSAMPGVPYVIQGNNRWISWRGTKHGMDVTDSYQEQVLPDANSPSGLSTVYLGQNEPIIPIPQAFRYNLMGDGVADNLEIAPPDGMVGSTYIPPVTLIVPRRNQGPIIALDAASGFALSVQFVGFSGTREVDFIRQADLARNLDDFKKALQCFDFGSQNWAYADVHGNIAVFAGGELPLREDLQSGTINGLPPGFIRNGSGGNEWLPVSNPQPGQSIPYEILPADEMPHIINPPAGFLVNANNDPLGVTADNDPHNDLRPGGGILYLAFNYGSPGMRAARITQRLSEALSERKLTAEDMVDVQADVILRDAQVFVPHILAACEHAMAPDADPMLAALADDPRVVEAICRLMVWDCSTPTGIPEGYDASDVDGIRSPPTSDEIQASVCATIYSVWRSQFIKNTVDTVVDSMGVPRPPTHATVKALRRFLDEFDSMGGVGASGLNFFDVPGVADPETRRDIILLSSLVDALDLLAGPDFADVFGGSTDQNDYRWGKLHRLVLPHPMGGPFNIPPAMGSFPPPLPGLDGIPIDGGYQTVDNARHDPRAADGGAFNVTSGPVHRYVAEVLKTGQIKARSSVAGSASGDPNSPWYLNVLERWLTNDTYPLRQQLAPGRDIAERILFLPNTK